MATQTTNYKLTKPDITDKVDVTILNRNADIIDQALQDFNDGKQDGLTFDDTPTANSTNPVTSGGVKTALDKKLNSEDYKLFTGASGENPGTTGIVPAPAAGGKYLSSDGAWETPDTAPTAGSEKLITSGAVKEALDNVEIDVDSAMSDSSTNPIQNKVVTGKMKSTSQADKAYHLGFYLDANGDLSYDYD